MPRKQKQSNKEIGARKVAVLLMAIGEDRASRFFAQMDDFEIRDISREMATLGQVPAEEMEEVLVEFVDTVGGGGGGVVGGWGTTERFLKTFMKEDRVHELMDEMRGPAGRTTWEKLANVSEDILANYLRNEYPQTVAVIVSRIRPNHAAKVLSALPQDFALEVIERILVIDNISREVIESVEESLKNEFMRNLASNHKRDSHELMADIFNNLDRANEAKFMELLENKSEEDAEKIRSLMFTFEDILRTNDAGIQLIMREIEKDKLPLALKGASEELKDRILKNMSERAAKILQEDMEALGPVRVKDVDEAQSAIVTVAKRLADENQITIIQDGEEGEEEFL